MFDCVSVFKDPDGLNPFKGRVPPRSLKDKNVKPFYRSLAISNKQIMNKLNLDIFWYLNLV